MTAGSRFCSARNSVLALSLLSTLSLAACGSKEEQAKAYYENGMRLLSAHSDQKAIIEFRNALRLEKDLLPAWRGMAGAEEALGDWEGLTQVLKTVLALDPSDAATRIKLAKIYLVGGAGDQALALVNEGRKDTPAVLAVKALIHFKLGDRKTAVKEARSALSAAAGDPDALLVLAADRLVDNDPNGALKLLSQTAPASQKDLEIEMLRIGALEQLKDYVKLEALLKELSALYPKETIFRKRLVDLYLFQHRPQDAEQMLRAIAAANPTNQQFALDVARFLYRVKGPSAARAELVSLINRGGDIFPYQLALANLDLNQGNLEDAGALLAPMVNSNVESQAASAKVLLAQVKVRQNDPDAAGRILVDVLQHDSRNVDALHLQASLRLDRNQFESAIADLRQALNEQPQATDLMLLLATAYERNGAIDLAEKEFADALNASGFNPGVGLSYVNFLNRHGRGDSAEATLTDLANRNPTNVQILSALAETKLARQDWGGAQTLAEKIKSLGNADSIADEILGISLSYQHNYDASIAAFMSAVAESHAAAAEPMVAMVGAFVRAKKVDRAIAFLRSTLQRDPNNAEAYVMLGEIAQSDGKLDQAEKSFKSAIDRQPKVDIGYRALSDLYGRQKRWEEALSTIRSGLTLLPNDAALRLALGNTLEARGDYDAAIEEYSALLKQQPNSMIVANNLASLLADHRSDTASLEQARALAASLQGSGVAQFQDTLGWIYSREGNFAAALPLLEAAAARLPGLALVHYHLGASYIEAGDVSKGTNELKIALKQNPDPDLEARINTRLNKLAANAPAR